MRRGEAQPLRPLPVVHSPKLVTLWSGFNWLLGKLTMPISETATLHLAMNHWAASSASDSVE